MYDVFFELFFNNGVGLISLKIKKYKLFYCCLIIRSVIKY